MRIGGEQWTKLVFSRKGPLSFGTGVEIRRESGKPVAQERLYTGKGLEKR